MLRKVQAIRYVMPFREGGSVPALVEADDQGMYVVKLRGAGQGPKALVAEYLSGELARAAGLLVPEIVWIEIDRALTESEPDPEIFSSLEASVGENLGLDYLPGSITFDAVAGPIPDAATASLVVLFDAFVTNVDRTPRNPNLLTWHRQLWLIDHGASLYFHHGMHPDRALDGSDDPFVEVRDHALLRWASALGGAAELLRGHLTVPLIQRLVDEIPESLLDDPRFDDKSALRAAYAGWLEARLPMIPALVEEAERARALLVRLRHRPRRPAGRAR